MAISYCRVEDVLLNHQRIPDTVDEKVAITTFIELAEGQINDKLRAKYTVPFTTVSPTIRMATMNLATYWELRRLSGANTGITPEMVKEYKDEAEGMIGEIAECTVNFDSDDATRQTLVSSNTNGRVKIFDLGPVFAQTTHPQDDDERYGEDA